MSQDKNDDKYRVIMLNNGKYIIGKILKTNSNTISVSDPVVCSISDGEIFFTILFKGISNNKSYDMSLSNILTIGNVDNDIKLYYERYLDETYKDIEDLKNDNYNEEIYNKSESTSNTIDILVKSIKGTMH
mgnify:CR=1 FL=1